MKPEEVKTLIDQGYRRTSNKYGLISRIDREDWVDALLDHLMPWRHRPNREQADIKREAAVKANIGTDGSWEDFYRRVLSKDKMELGQQEGKKFPPSQWDKTGYCPKR